jgi:hypothetical protein
MSENIQSLFLVKKIVISTNFTKGDSVAIDSYMGNDDTLHIKIINMKDPLFKVFLKKEGHLNTAPQFIEADSQWVLTRKDIESFELPIEDLNIFHQALRTMQMELGRLTSIVEAKLGVTEVTRHQP